MAGQHIESWLPVNKVALGLELANPNCRARKAIRQSRVRDMNIEENLVSFCDVIGVKGIQSDVSSN
jgi:hypothetical protein